MGSQPGIRLFQTAAHPCGYWPDREASDLILDPTDPRLGAVYGEALARGFRRSGGHVYRPHCGACQACVAVRIPVKDFVASRSQRRCRQRNADLAMTIAPARRSDENFALYQRYLSARHAGGGMDEATPQTFDAFLACRWSPTSFLEFRLGPRLLAVAVTDVVHEALSAVYTYYDPDEEARGLGTYAILQQVEFARQQGRQHLYLGFWLDGHAKMDYKRRFRPLEWLDGRSWQPFSQRSDSNGA